MSDFVPPYPTRLRRPPWPWTRLRLARANTVAIWEESAFALEFSHERVFTRTTFLCNSPESVQFAFNLKNASFERKGPQTRHALEPLIGDSLFISDGETATTPPDRRADPACVAARRVRQGHGRNRRRIARRWASLSGEVDVSKRWRILAEIICPPRLAASSGATTPARRSRALPSTSKRSARSISFRFLACRIGCRACNAKARRAQRRINRARRDDRRLSITPRNRRSFGDQPVTDARDGDGKPLDEVTLRNEAAMLFLAGHETTANTMAWVWFLLSQCPEVEARLHAELDGVLDGRLPALADLRQLTYTQAVVEEALRLYPPLPILPREVLQEETFNGVRIPKGSMVFVVPWLLHRHRRLWDKPDHFIPERFLPGSKEPVSKYAFVPFSIGPRVCVGQSFALTETILCIATLAQHFRLRLRPGYVVEPVCRLTLRPDGGLPMTIEPRARTTAATPVH